MKYIKQFFDSIFNLSINDTSYKKTIINFCILSILLYFLTSILGFLIDNYIVRAFIAYFVITPAFLCSLIFFIGKLISISDNREKEKKKNGNYKTKYKPIDVDFNDIVFWLEKTEEPETLLCKYNNKYFQVEVSFDVDRQSGPYYNKQFYLDEKNVNIDELIDLLKEKAIDNKICVYETFDHNKPEILLEEIKDVKNKNRE